MSPEERVEVVASLPSELPFGKLGLPEGDRHSRPLRKALDLLERHFSRQGRGVYLASDLLVYYPGEGCFAPDLLAVVDVEPHEREKWAVQEEKRGLDWVLEVHVHGDRKKDAKLNVQRYARLGIREYFFLDRAREELTGYRLTTSGKRRYRRLKARRGRYKSVVLGLELEVKDGQLRFWAGSTLLLESAELIDRLQRLTQRLQKHHRKEARLRKEAARRLAEEIRHREEAEQRREEEIRCREEAEQRREEEIRCREEEARRREEAERRIAELQAEVKRLRRPTH